MVRRLERLPKVISGPHRSGGIAAPHRGAVRTAGLRPAAWLSEIHFENCYRIPGQSGQSQPGYRNRVAISGSGVPVVRLALLFGWSAAVCGSTSRSTSKHARFRWYWGKIQTPNSKIQKSSNHPSSNDCRGLGCDGLFCRSHGDGRLGRIGPCCLELGACLEIGSWSLVFPAGSRSRCVICQSSRLFTTRAHGSPRPQILGHSQSARVWTSRKN